MEGFMMMQDNTMTESQNNDLELIDDDLPEIREPVGLRDAGFLCQIEHHDSLYVDHLLVEDGYLKYMTIVGSDTAVREFIARLHTNIQDDENQLKISFFNVKAAPQIEYRCESGEYFGRLGVFVGDSRLLDYTYYPLASDTYPNKLVYAVIKHQALTKPDHSTQTVWFLSDCHEVNQQGIIADLICKISHIPVLPHWVETLKNQPRLKTMVQEFGTPMAGVEIGNIKNYLLGDFCAYKISIPIDFETIVSDLIKKGVLTFTHVKSPIKHLV